VPRPEPLSPPLLAVAGALAALPAAWLALAAGTVASAAAGTVVGFPRSALALSRTFTLVADQVVTGSHAPIPWAVFLLADPAGSALVGLALHAGAQLLRGLVALRVLLFQFAAFALLRLPLLVVAGALPGGRGPVDALYRRLGDPESGRWAVGALGLLLLWGAVALVARLAVGSSRGWMRVDGRGFRRRLVRVVAGYPALAALTAWSVVAPWAPIPWMVILLLLVAGGLHFLTV
jgi:hypothetical protein